MCLCFAPLWSLPNNSAVCVLLLLFQENMTLAISCEAEGLSTEGFYLTCLMVSVVPEHVH